MSRLHRTLTLASLAAACLLACAGVSAADAPEPDVARLWEDFLAHGQTDKVVDAMNTAIAVRFDGVTVDPEQCAIHARRLADGAAAVPVSIAIRRANYLCAVARKDEGTAARESAALSALARHALQLAGDAEVGRPIPIVWASDAHVLFRILDLDVRYEYYQRIAPDRYLPMVLVGWENERKLERHFAFDYVDVHYQLDRKSEYAGYPALRWSIAAGSINRGAESGYPAAIDARAIRAARDVDTDAEKIGILRVAAAKDGVQSAFAWLRQCVRAGKERSAAVCPGLVDALLAQAEGGKAMPLVMLAVAYHEGLDTQADPATAYALLDRAQQAWPGAVSDFVISWRDLFGDKPLPAEVERRLQAAAERGSRSAQRRLIEAALAQDKPLSDAQRAFLAQPAENARGWGYMRLSDDALTRKDKAALWDWRRKAADSGEALAQSDMASALIYGDVPQVQADPDKGVRMAEAAAHGGDAWAARQLAYRREDKGDYAGAERWLLAPAYAGDDDATYVLAGLYADEYPGVSENAEHAVEIFQGLARSPDNGARARRALARMAVNGVGMKKDAKRALAWLRDDAIAGDTASQTLLGGYYLDGLAGAPDEREGRRWLEKATKGGDEEAVTVLATWLYHHKPGQEARSEAMSLFAQAYAAGNKDVLNNYAWALCTSIDPQVFDARRGLEVAAKMGAAESLAPGEMDTVAACHAANGEFTRAVALQERASRDLGKLRGDGGDGDNKKGEPPSHERRLALYRAGKRYEEDPAHQQE